MPHSTMDRFAGHIMDMGLRYNGFFLFVSGFGMYFSLECNRPIGWHYVAGKLLKIIKPWLFF